MYALVNTFEGSDRYLGRIVSQHRTVEACDAADTKLQRAVVKGNGQSSYIPTVVVELTVRKSGKARLETGEYRTLDRSAEGR